MKNHANQFICKGSFIFTFLFTFSLISIAQGDGHRSQLLSPVGVWGIGTKYMHLNQNLTPSGEILVKSAEFNVNVFPVAAFHTFSFMGNYAQIVAAVTPSNATLDLTGLPPGFPSNFSDKGFSDGFIGLKVGLVGAPALTVAEFAKHKPTFSMYNTLKIWYSGSYDSNEVLNLGSNRMTIQYGVPMTFPLGKNRSRMTWLEIFPSIKFFGANTEPLASVEAQKIQQAPLFLIEGHLSHNFTKKLWASINLGYRYGGRTTTDEVENDNKLSLLGGSVGIGYQLLPFIGLSADFGKRIAGENNAESTMVRVGMVFSYVNIKKQNN